MSSPQSRAESTLGTITTHLWAGADDHALAVVQVLIAVTRATPHQQRANGAAWEIEIDTALSQAYALPNLGASDGVFTNDTERRWLSRLRRFAFKQGVQVVRKWQNRLIFHAREDRAVVRDLARVLAGWIVEDFKARHVAQVEDATITLTEEVADITRVRFWHVHLDDGREVQPSGRRRYSSFLDALYVAQSIKEGRPGARYAKRPLLWGTY